jgi:hypothetical protein
MNVTELGSCQMKVLAIGDVGTTWRFSRLRDSLVVNIQIGVWDGVEWRYMQSKASL